MCDQGKLNQFSNVLCHGGHQRNIRGDSFQEDDEETFIHQVQQKQLQHQQQQKKQQQQQQQQKVQVLQYIELAHNEHITLTLKRSITGTDIENEIVYQIIK